MSRPKRIRCFWLEPTDKAQVSLRRYRDSVRYLRNEDGSYKLGDDKCCVPDPSYNGKCPAGNYCCDASVVIGECEYSERAVHVTDEMKKEEKWPTKCECGYEFKPEDHWQWNENRLYKRADTGELHILGRAPVGAMWNADWYDIEGYAKRGADGRILVLNTPGGQWVIDGRATNNKNIPGWTRSGSPPDITANPSIICGDYHGWLRNGWLEEC
jgi:hypothetical protein